MLSFKNISDECWMLRKCSLSFIIFIIISLLQPTVEHRPLPLHTILINFGLEASFSSNFINIWNSLNFSASIDHRAALFAFLIVAHSWILLMLESTIKIRQRWVTLADKNNKKMCDIVYIEKIKGGSFIKLYVNF